MKLNRKLFWTASLTSLFLLSIAYAGAKLDTTIWTDWHIQPTRIQQLLGLADMRDKLDKFNLHDAYSKGQVLVDCSSPEKKSYRQADGTCNDLKNTVMGAKGQRLSRNVKDLSTLPREVDEKAMEFPNPLLISRELLSRPTRNKNDDSYDHARGLNVIAAAWIQFETHDWFNHGQNMNDVTLFSAWNFTDAKAGPFDLSRLILPRTKLDTTRTYDNVGYPTYTNDVTHWWDGSQIYGSESALQQCDHGTPGPNSLRECKSGRIKLEGANLLPFDVSADKELTGFNQNWWIGLSFLHTLFTRNHNSIAQQLQAKYPSWDDEKLFQIARLVNAAVMAKIHTVEWTPGILANKTLDLAMNANWYGLEKDLELKKHGDLPTVGWLSETCKWFKKKSESVQKFCDVAGGLVGGKRDLHGAAFSMTEEFAAVYRLHSLLPENIEMQTPQGVQKIAMLNLRDGNARRSLEKYGVATVAKSMGRQNPGSLTIRNFPRFLRNIKIEVPGAKGILPSLDFDMAAVDIIRDRERGIPRYNEFRRQVQLLPIRDFTDLMPQDTAANREITEKMRQIYGNDVEKIDLLVGTLAESYRPQGYGFGETLFQIFICMASRRLQADRFYTTDFTDETYSHEGMDIINHATMKNVIMKNIPGIPDAMIPANAFAPWKKI